MIKIAICEDVKEEQMSLQSKLIDSGHISNPTIEFFDNGKLLLNQFLKGIRYDFVFLDVDMPLMNGIDVGKAISNYDNKAIIIFVTN